MKIAQASGVAAMVATITMSVFMFEGGFVDHPNDPGGATMYGITEKVARVNGYTGEMKDLPKELADEIYTREYVYGPGYDKVIVRIPAVGHKLVDSGVNLGTTKQTKSLQKALNALNAGKTPDIKEDGVMGASTLTALDLLEKRLGERKACVLLIRLLDAQQAVHYMELKRLRMFTVGWVDHRIGNVSCDNVY